MFAYTITITSPYATHSETVLAMNARDAATEAVALMEHFTDLENGVSFSVEESTDSFVGERWEDLKGIARWVGTARCLGAGSSQNGVVPEPPL